ncbi:hypothetical protein BD779DRAFT_1673187 [Infundibulicybe gibba]|nr:hypothetical protein BD779DRAFT_1673187 [Infundibulicybe gibba]
MDAPTEIIQRVFLELCSPQTRFPLVRGEIIVLLTHISSRWRAIALAMPELWTNILIDDHHQPDFPHLFDLINTWISRSGQSMLSFEFAWAYECHPSSVFDLILPHIRRCSSLNLHLDRATRHRLLSLPPSSLSSLQTITITGKAAELYVVSPSEDPHITAFQSCSQLQHAAFLFHGRDINVTHFKLPWHQLTDLDFATFSASADSLLGVLGKCISLEYCKISVSDISPLILQNILPFSYRPIVLPSLHHLSLSFPNSWKNQGDRDSDSHFLAALRCPRLRELTLSSPSSSPLSLSSLHLFYGASSETLEDLDLYGLTCYHYLVETLYLLPHLKTLNYFDRSSLFPDIAHQLGEGTIAPHLTTLGICGVDIDELLDVVEARVNAARANPNIATFVDVYAVRPCAGKWIDKGRLVALKEAGVGVEIDNW